MRMMSKSNIQYQRSTNNCKTFGNSIYNAEPTTIKEILHSDVWFNARILI